MRLKLYRAPSVPEAMARVRAELGAEALIIGSRRVSDGVELTAALEPEELPRPASPRFATLPLNPGSRPLLLIGPPGAGKTLTVVRIATRLVMTGVAPLVIAADGNKAGATEQLLAFMRLLDLPLAHAHDPVTLARAITKRRNGAPVLIDAPGSDPFDSVQADALRALIAAANACVALVLPAGLDPEEAVDLGRAYATLGADLLIATRLDLTRRLGGVLAAAEAGGLALTEAGVGPGAADGLVPLTPEFLRARLLQSRKPRHDA